MRHTHKNLAKTPAGVSAICNMEISLLNTSYSSPFYQWKQGKGLCLHKVTRRNCLVQLCTPRILAFIFFLVNRQQWSAVIYPLPSMAHKELPSFVQFLSQSKGIPDKTSCQSRCQSTPWPCLCPSDHYLTLKQSSDIKDGG